MPFLLFAPVGATELILIGILVLVVFGAKRLPMLGAGLGQGIRNFKESISGKEEKLEEGNQESKEEAKAP